MADTKLVQHALQTLLSNNDNDDTSSAPNHAETSTNKLEPQGSSSEGNLSNDAKVAAISNLLLSRVATKLIPEEEANSHEWQGEYPLEATPMDMEHQRIDRALDDAFGWSAVNNFIYEKDVGIEVSPEKEKIMFLAMDILDDAGKFEQPDEDPRIKEFWAAFDEYKAKSKMH